MSSYQPMPLHLETERLRLQPWDESDAEDLCALHSERVNLTRTPTVERARQAIAEGLARTGPRLDVDQPPRIRLCGRPPPRETVYMGAHLEPAFAADPQTLAYYDRRAGEYDEWYTGAGVFAARDRPGWNDEVAAVIELTASLPPARTLDVACGTGFLTQHLRGFVVGIDQSPAMVAIAQSRLPDGLAIVGDALHLVVADHAFGRVFTSHFYGHLSALERRSFLAEARRVASELVVVDSALRPGVGPEQWQERILNDGSRHRVYKRYLTGDQLARELTGETLFEGTWFVAARTSW